MTSLSIYLFIRTIQAIRAEGKEMVLALGLTKMSTTDMYVPVHFTIIDVVGVFFYVFLRLL